MNYGISIVAGLFLLINAFLGFAGKTLPFTGMNQYTTDSLRKLAHIMCIPELIAGILFFVALYFNMSGHISYPAYFVAIGFLLILFIAKIVIKKRILERN
ncbi:MAG: hypothetical protein PHS74_03145 [Lachnospiraceae bacterium]|nr:hypothetical protein [Lachnospiraceae bacterium]